MTQLARRDTFALAAAALAAPVAAAAVPPPPTSSHPIAPVRVRGVAIGEGRAKTMVSLTETSREGTLTRARLLATTAEVDIVEFRLDHLAAPTPAAVGSMLPEVTQAIGGKPLVVTFRTKDEGGEKAIAPAAYAALYEAVLASGAGDVFDLQMALLATPAVAALKARAQAAGRRVILSHHDFQQTPPTDTMIALLRREQALGADICKIAVMPHDPDDVLRLLAATWTMRRDHADRPLVTMAMGGVGAVSRLAGEVFGSALSVGSLGESSAPGQVKIADLRKAIDSIHAALDA